MQEYWVNVYLKLSFTKCIKWDTQLGAILAASDRSRLQQDKCLYRIHVKIKRIPIRETGILDGYRS